MRFKRQQTLKQKALEVLDRHRRFIRSIRHDSLLVRSQVHDDEFFEVLVGSGCSVDARQTRGERQPVYEKDCRRTVNVQLLL